jgi:hypothetical protein
MMDTHRADPTARRTTLVLLLFAAAAGALLIFGAGLARPSVQAWVEEDLHSRLTIVVLVLTVIAAGPPLGLAFYLWQFGGRVIATARFPPPEARVIKDVPVVSGEAARSRGRALRLFAAMIAIGALLIGAILLRLAVLVWTQGSGIGDQGSVV